MKPKVFYPLVGLTFGVLLVSALLAFSPKARSKTKTEKPIDVVVAPAQKMDLAQKVFSVGTLVAIQSVVISSEVDGRVTNVFFKDGQYVTKGTAVIQLDNVQAKADLASAQTALKLSKATYQRYLLLSKEGGVSRQELDQRRADMESKESAVQSAIATLKQKTLLAPFSGRLGAFKISEGNYIKAGDPLVSLVNKRLLKVEYTLPEVVLPKLAVGQEIIVTTDSFPNEEFSGQVTFISPSVNVDTRTVSVQATIPNPDERLSPGMFVHVSEVIAQEKNAVLIPDEAIIAGLKGSTVYRIVKGRAVLTKVKLGEHKNGLTQVLSGIKADDNVVIAGQQKLHDGALVRIVDGDTQQKNQQDE